MSGIIMTLGGSWGISEQNLIRAQEEVASQLAARGAALMVEHMIANGQVLTASLINGVYVATPAGSGYGAAAGAARGRNPSVALVDDIGPSEPGSAAIGIAVAHADPQNYGTARQPARPFFEPALARLEEEMPSAMAVLWERLLA